MTASVQQQQGAAEALAGQTTYREHLHRGLILPLPAQEHRLAGIGQAFWPTRRDIDPACPLDPPIVNCQRCGKCVAPTAGWWCKECWKIVPWLQCCCGLSMVQIARMGEDDPPWTAWIQDFAPWLLAHRINLIRAGREWQNVMQVREIKQRARARTDTRSRNGRRPMMPRHDQIWEAT